MHPEAGGRELPAGVRAPLRHFGAENFVHDVRQLRAGCSRKRLYVLPLAEAVRGRGDAQAQAGGAGLVLLRRAAVVEQVIHPPLEWHEQMLGHVFEGAVMFGRGSEAVTIRPFGRV